MSEDIIEELTVIANKRERSINQIAQIAISEWLRTFTHNKKWYYLIITKDIFHRLLDYMDDSKMEILIKETSDLSAEILQDLMNIPLSEATLIDLIGVLPSFLCEVGFRWFVELTIKEENDNFTLKGFHYLGAGFSKFFTKMFQELMIRYFDYQTKLDNIKFTPNSVYLEFQPLNKTALFLKKTGS